MVMNVVELPLSVMALPISLGFHSHPSLPFCFTITCAYLNFDSVKASVSDTSSRFSFTNGLIKIRPFAKKETGFSALFNIMAQLRCQSVTLVPGFLHKWVNKRPLEKETHFSALDDSQF